MKATKILTEIEKKHEELRCYLESNFDSFVFDDSKYNELLDMYYFNIRNIINHKMTLKSKKLLAVCEKLGL